MMAPGRYDAIVELTRALNDRHSDPVATQQQTQRILLSLFPSWLPPAFKVAAPSSDSLVCVLLLGRPYMLACCLPQVMFSRPMPGLSCRLNAWVTALTCQWLMGPCKVSRLALSLLAADSICCHQPVHVTSTYNR